VAPEVLNDKGYDGRAADIWSAGVILYVLLAGFLPFDEPHMSALFRKIQKAEFTYPSWFSPQVRALIDTILVADPAARATIGDIEANPWFRGPDDYKDNNLAFSTPEAAAEAGVPFMGPTPTSAVSQAPLALPPGASSGAGAAAGGRSPLAHVPSAKDIADAVEDVADSAVSETSNKAGGAAASGVRVLNAFDVINMLGGLALNGLVEGSDKRRALAYTPQFLSAQPVKTILSKIESSLRKMGAGVNVDGVSGKLKGKLATPKGEISVVAVVYRMSEALHMVEVHRGKGDILEYSNIYARMREDCADIVANKAK
jgi:hypothetical protein